MKNLLITSTLLLLSNLIVLGQLPCDTTGTSIYTYLENPPEVNLQDEVLEERLNATFRPDIDGLSGVEYIYVIYYINCEGEDYKYQIVTLRNGKTSIDSTSTFSNELEKLLKNNLDFEPAYMLKSKRGVTEKITVDFQGGYTIQYRDNNFSILTEKEKKKHNKNKK